MRKKCIQHVIIPGILVITTFLSEARAQDHFSDLEEWKPYTPSRLSWLAVDLNANLRVPMSVNNGYLMTFVPVENEDTILIYVRYLPSVNREAMNIVLNSAREVISIRAKVHGWTSWLKVKEDVRMVARSEQY